MKKPKRRKKKYYTLKYKKITVKLDKNPRTGVCVACGKSVHKGEIKTTQMHHTMYVYKSATVKKKPKLALENTVELCYLHHKLADVIRVLTYYNPMYIVEVFDVLPERQKQRLIRLCREI